MVKICRKMARKEAWRIKREKAAPMTLHLHMTLFREIGCYGG